MKKILTICALSLFLAYSLPFFRPLLQSSAPAKAETVTLIDGEEERSLDMTGYLVGVVAAELPAKFEFEALKAQAVAARSYAMYCIDAGKHNGRLCTSSGCCQAYIDESTMKSRWGSDFEKNRNRILKAVNDTAGEYLSYMGSPAQAVFHSSSAEMTENSAQLWNAVDYLVSVSSPEKSGDVPGYISYVSISPEELRNTILSRHPEAVFSENPSEWVGDTAFSASGRVESISIGGAKISGREMRSMFALRSTAFVLSQAGGQFLFTVTGFGHGVGMSQYGANVMAREGADYASILAHYYPGTRLSRSDG